MTVINALSLCVVKKKYRNCDQFSEREASAREFLNRHVREITDEDLVRLSERVKANFDDLTKRSNEQRQKIDRLNTYIKDLKSFDHAILSPYNEDHDFDDFADHLRATWHSERQTAEKQIADLNQERIDALVKFAELLFIKFGRSSNDCSPSIEPEQAALQAANRFVTQYQELIDNLAKAVDIFKQTISEIAQFLYISPPRTTTVYGEVLTILGMLENDQNTRARLVGELEEKYSQMINVIRILRN
jgi:septal ring factor EnvC (AmiA/AmiB activator)